MNIQDEIDLTQLRIRTLGDDNLCMCSCAHVCPLGKMGTMARCTKAELLFHLEKLGANLVLDWII